MSRLFLLISLFFTCCAMYYIFFDDSGMSAGYFIGLSALFYAFSLEERIKDLEKKISGENE